MPNSPKSGLDLFRASRIPGSVFFDFDECAEKSELPHMMPSAARFRGYMSSLGIKRTDDIIIYDSGLFSAPRMVFTLSVFNHLGTVSILSRGLSGYSGPLCTSPPSILTQDGNDYGECVKNEDMIIGYEELVSGNNVVLDARSQGRFDGTADEPRQGLPSGHMPDSICIPFQSLIQEDQLLPREKIIQVFEKAGVDLRRSIVTSCGSGMTAAILWLALKSIGIDARIYDESWTGYAARKDAIILSSSS